MLPIMCCDYFKNSRRHINYITKDDIAITVLSMNINKY